MVCEFHEGKRVLIHICILGTQSTFNKYWTKIKTQSWTAFYNCSLNSVPSCYQLSQALLFILPFLSWFHLWDCPHTVIFAAWLQFWLSLIEILVPEPWGSLLLFWPATGLYAVPMLAQDCHSSPAKIYVGEGSASLQTSWIKTTFIWATLLKNFQSKNRKALQPHSSCLLVLWKRSWTTHQERNKEMAMKSDWMNKGSTGIHWKVGIEHLEFKRPKKVLVLPFFFPFSKCFGG